jgi:hypothetical protein
MRLIRLVVGASSSVLSVDDETKMNRKKHECSLLEVFSDVGSTPTASTISKLSIYSTHGRPRYTMGDRWTIDRREAAALSEDRWAEL